MCKKTLALTIAFVICLLLTSGASADIHRWVDENGVTHFSDTPPPSENPDETLYEPPRANLETQPIPKVRIPTPKEKLAEENKRAIRKSKVELYTTEWCPACKDAKKWLRRNKIRYQDYDIERDKAAAERFRGMGNGGLIPLAIINGEKITGFDPGKFRKALGIE